MHKNDRNFKKFLPAAPIGTAGTQFLLFILKNRFKFSIYESKIQKFFACGATIFHLHIFLPLPPEKNSWEPSLRQTFRRFIIGNDKLVITTVADTLYASCTDIRSGRHFLLFSDTHRGSHTEVPGPVPG